MSHTIISSELLDTIHELESILEVLPEDITTLNSLIFAYQQSGDSNKASAKAEIVGNVLSRGQKWDQLYDLAAQYMDLDPENMTFLKLFNQAEEQRQFQTPSEAIDTGIDEFPGTSLSDIAFELNNELDLAWNLLESKLVNETQYETAVGTLSENRANPNYNSALSFLAEVNNLDHVNMPRITAHLSKESGTPYIDISRFSIQPEVQKLIPVQTAKQLGVVPFSKFGNDVLIALLNPMNQEIKQALTAFLGANIHYYLSNPDDIQSYYDKLKTT